MFRTLKPTRGREGVQVPVLPGMGGIARQRAANKQQVRQLAGLRGHHGQTQRRHHRETDSRELPRSLSVLEYFISTHGAARAGRHRPQDADSGYMTRKLVDVSQDVIIQEDDCGRPMASGFPLCSKAEDEVVKRPTGSWAGSACDDESSTDESQGISHSCERGNGRGKGQTR